MFNSIDARTTLPDSNSQSRVPLGLSASQVERDEALQCFRFGVTRVLVATGVAARGLDIPDVTHVVNIDMPAEIDEYIHRIGRTGRAGRQGIATTFFSALDSAMAAELSIVLRQSLQEVPKWLESIGEKVRQAQQVTGLPLS